MNEMMPQRRKVSPDPNVNMDQPHDPNAWLKDMLAQMLPGLIPGGGLGGGIAQMGLQMLRRKLMPPAGGGNGQT